MSGLFFVSGEANVCVAWAGAGLGAGGATPALGSDYGSETPYGGLGLGATPAATSGAVQENGTTVRIQFPAGLKT